MVRGKFLKKNRRFQSGEENDEKYFYREHKRCFDKFCIFCMPVKLVNQFTEKMYDNITESFFSILRKCCGCLILDASTIDKMKAFEQIQFTENLSH